MKCVQKSIGQRKARKSEVKSASNLPDRGNGENAGREQKWNKEQLLKDPFLEGKNDKP